jgi:tetratricopeptide (TPR) repeat protein
MWKRTMTAAVAMAAMVLATPLLAQSTTATVHGHVNDAVGVIVAGAQVKFTTDKTSQPADRKYPYSFDTDASGDYKATVPPGDYLVVIFKGTTQADYQLITVKAGDDKTLNFDMTRAEYINSLTPEERKNVEEFKKKNAAATSANTVIAKLNATLKTVRADLAAAMPTKADVSADVASMKEAVGAKADSGLLWITYGDVLLAQADHLASEDKKAGKAAMSDDDVVKMYQDSADAYKKGIDLDSAGDKPKLAEAAVGYNQMGTALAREGKVQDATAAFEGAIKDDPTKAGMYYKNEAVILFNSGQSDAALEPAEKAIAADPNEATAYFIKAKVLIAKATLDPKTQKLVAPPGCVDAYQHFLSLQPDGPNAQEAKDVLAGLGEKVDLNYKKGKK